MKKKSLLSTAILSVLAGNAVANAPSPAFSGLYVGGGLTYSKSNLKSDFSTNTLSNKSATFSSSGVGGNGFIGYGQVVYGGLYLGGELSLGFDGSHFKDKTYTNRGIEVRLKSKSKITYNVVGRIGYVFSNFLAYAKVGFEGRSKIIILDNDGNSAININRNGLLLGAGGDYAITRNVFLRTEYHYNFGSRKKWGDSNNSLTLRTPTHTVLIGGAYKF